MFLLNFLKHFVIILKLSHCALKTIETGRKVRANYTNLEVNPEKNVPKLGDTSFLSEFRGETEFDMPKLPSLGHFERIKVLKYTFFEIFKEFGSPKH